MDSAGRGRGKGEKKPARRGWWKAKHPLISCASLHLWKWLSNQSKRVKLKTGSTVFRQKQKHVELMSEMARQFLFQPEKKWLRQNLLCDHKYELIFAALCFWNENPWVLLPLSIWQFFFFLPFDRKRYFEEPNNSTRRFTRHNLFDTNWHTLVKPCGCFFDQRKKWLHLTVLCWRKYELKFAALYILQMTIRERCYR